MLGFGPQPPYRGLRLRGHVNRHAVLLRHAVPASDRGGPLHGRVAPLDLLTGHADGDHSLPRAAVRAPQEVGVVPAYGRWKAILSAQEVKRAGLAVVGGEYAGLGALPGGEALVGARDGLRHVLPPEPIPKWLREDALLALAGRRVGRAAQGPVGRGEGGRGQDGHRERREEDAA